MQQSRLEKFFSTTKTTKIDSTDDQTTINNKRLLSTIDEDAQTIKRRKSDETIESQNSLNKFYLEKFLSILSTLLEHKRFLFSTEELKKFETFEKLNVSSQIVFVRILMRRCKWLRESTIKYEMSDKIDNLTPLVEVELVQDISFLDDVEVGLKLLTGEEMKNFSKKFHCQSKSKKSKKVSIENLKNLSHQYKSIFGSETTNNRDKILLKELKKILKNCYKISEEIRGLFFRMVLVHHPVALSSMDELDQNAFSIFFKRFQINRGQIRMPWKEEEVQKKNSPFRSAEDLKSFEETIDLQSEFDQLEKSKNIEALINFYEIHQENLKNFVDQPRENENFPDYFRRFSSEYVRARLLSSFTEILQRARRYDESIDLIKFLLDRPSYNRHRRGKLWNRLALIQENYVQINGQEKCLETIYGALKDQTVKLGERLALCDRARKLISRIKIKGNLSIPWTNDPEENLILNVPMPNEIQITARLLPNDGRMGKVTYAIENPQDGSVQYCSVEELAIHHYRTELNFSLGIHSEGSIIRTIIGILFLDIIYTLPHDDLLIDVFQTEPLDFQTDQFYFNRKNLIDQRIDQIKTEKAIEQIAETNWAQYHLVTSSMVNWNLFQTKSIFLDALKCLTSEQIQSIAIYTFVHNRAVWKGFPDLFVWNPVNKKCKFVEVKSHNDRLSFHQIVWLNQLVQWKIDCEVCKVVANGTKKNFQRTTSLIELD